MDSSGTESRLRAHVEALAGTIGERHLLRPHALAAAADYIDAAWRAQGYVPERETFTVDGVDCANLVITRPGRLDELLLIGAHYDTVRGSPGADDNASGVAGAPGAVARIHRRRAESHGALRRLHQRGAALLLHPPAGQRRARQGRPGARRADRVDGLARDAGLL